MTMFAFVAFTVVREHGGRFLSSGMSLGACGGHVPTLCLRFTRSFVSVAWRSTSVAFLLVPLPPSAFVLIYLFSYLFFRGLVHLLPLGFWPQCDGCYSGGAGRGGLVAGLPVGRPVGVLPPWGVLRLQPPGPLAPNLHLRRRR